jgi:hypothetical protein
MLPAGAVVGSLILVWEFMSLYGARGYSSPIANDTLKYIWRSNLVGAQGLHALSAIPAGTTINADRPGFPLVASFLRAVLGVSPFRLTFVIPAVTSVLIGLAAATLAVEATDEPRWSFPVYLLGVGGSVNVALMSVGYLDNLVVGSVLMACAVCALLGADGRPAALGGATLLLGAVIVHWDFAALFAAILFGLLLVLVPESVLARRRGRALLQTPSGSVARVLGGAVVGAGLLLLAPALPQKPGASRSSFRHKLHIFAPLFHFEKLGPVAGGGLIALGLPARARRLRALSLLLGWSLTALAGYLALEHGFESPAHRLMLFALAIPFLATAAVVGIARATSLLGVPGRVLGALVVLSGLAIGALAAHVQWYQRGHPVMRLPGFGVYHTTQAAAFAQAATAGTYVDRYAHGRPAVYVVEAQGGNARTVGVAAAGVIRDAIPPEQIPRTGIYLGRVDRLLEGQPTRTPEGVKFNRISLKFWGGVEPLVRGSVVIVLRSFNPGIMSKGPPAGFPVAPGVRVARGPRPTDPVPVTPPPQSPSVLYLGLLAVAVIVVLSAAGSGWAAALVPAGWTARASLAPAFGIAVLATSGLLLDRAGLRLAGGAGAAAAVGTAALGWALWWGLRRRTSES